MTHLTSQINKYIQGRLQHVNYKVEALHCRIDSIQEHLTDTDSLRLLHGSKKREKKNLNSAKIQVAVH